VLRALCIFLLIACYYDYRYRRIPNILLLMMLITGLLWSFWNRGIGGMFLLAMAVVLPMVLLYPFFKIGALGAGDVKLFGVCSGYLSLDRILYFLFFSMLIAALFSLIKLMVTRNIKEYRKIRMPLAGPVFCSILLYIGGVY